MVTSTTRTTRDDSILQSGGADASRKVAVAGFYPNVTPEQMFRWGSFGGTYWRPIESNVTNRRYRNKHREFAWAKTIPDDKLTRTTYDKKINKFGVKVGSTLVEWEHKGWIKKKDPYGWVQWYCRYVERRKRPTHTDTAEDHRQMVRWLRLAGTRGRFRNRLIRLILEKRAKFDDPTVSPRIRQTLQHWAYKLTKKHYDAGVKRIRSKEKN